MTLECTRKAFATPSARAQRYNTFVVVHKYVSYYSFLVLCIYIVFIYIVCTVSDRHFSHYPDRFPRHARLHIQSPAVGRGRIEVAWKPTGPRMAWTGRCDWLRRLLHTRLFYCFRVCSEKLIHNHTFARQGTVAPSIRARVRQRK